MAYNSHGKRIRSENLAGQVTTTAWDQFACTSVDELISAAKNAKSAKHAYDFDDIGNRETLSECGTNSVYAANQLNQYTAVDDFTPEFDDDGNQTLVKTATGIWSVTYNGENRPKEKLRGRKMRVTRKIEAPRGGLWNKTRTDTVIVYDHVLEEVLNEFAQENGMIIPDDDYGDWLSDENDDRKKKFGVKRSPFSVV